MLRRFPLVFLAMPGALAADFVGNKACAPCHAAIYRSYLRTPMAQSSGTVGTQDVSESFDRAEFRDDRGAYLYRVAADYRFAFIQQGAREPISGLRALTYFIG